jgi:hypothetical protein
MAEEISPLENHNWWMERLRKDAKANRPDAPQPDACAASYTRPPRQWQTLSEEECEAFKKAVEEKLREKNSTLACIPAVPPGT